MIFAVYDGAVPKVYRAGVWQRAINAIFRLLAKRGNGAHYLHVLTVTGRKSGRKYSVPVDVMDVDGIRYLVAPYGEVGWVRNVRASKVATLQRGANEHDYDAVEMEPSHTVSVIREYVRSVPVTKAYWNVNEHSTDAEVIDDAQSHPVFRLSRR